MPTTLWKRTANLPAFPGEEAERVDEQRAAISHHNAERLFRLPPAAQRAR